MLIAIAMLGTGRVNPSWITMLGDGLNHPVPISNGM